MASGNIIGGHTTNFFGRKRQIIFSFILVAFSVGMVVFVPDAWVAMAFAVIANFFSGMGAAGTINLTVEQTPNCRGTIMSMSTVFVHFGQAIGAAIGGALLYLFESYQVLALVFIGFNLAAASIYLFFTKDPCR